MVSLPYQNKFDKPHTRYSFAGQFEVPISSVDPATITSKAVYTEFPEKQALTNANLDSTSAA